MLENHAQAKKKNRMLKQRYTTNPEAPILNDFMIPSLLADTLIHQLLQLLLTKCIHYFRSNITLAEISVIIMRSVVIFMVGPPGLKIGCILRLFFPSVLSYIRSFMFRFFSFHEMDFTVLCVAKNHWNCLILKFWLVFMCANI